MIVIELSLALFLTKLRHTMVVVRPPISSIVALFWVYTEVQQTCLFEVTLLITFAYHKSIGFWENDLGLFFKKVLGLPIHFILTTTHHLIPLKMLETTYTQALFHIAHIQVHMSELLFSFYVFEIYQDAIWSVGSAFFEGTEHHLEH